MRKLLAVVFAFAATAAFAQRGGAIHPLQNAAQSCADVGGVEADAICGVPNQWCVDFVSRFIYSCDPATSTWKAVAASTATKLSGPTTSAEVNAAVSDADFLTNDGTEQSFTAAKTITTPSGGWPIFKRGGTGSTDAAMEFQTSTGNTRVRVVYGNGAGSHPFQVFDNTATSGTGCTGSGTPWSCCTGSGTGTCTTERSYFTNTGTFFAYDGTTTGQVPNLASTGSGGSITGEWTFATSGGKGISNLRAKKQGSYRFNCDYDWDSSGTIAAADIKSCLDAAEAALGTAEDGTDHAVDVKLPEGTFDLSAVSGMCPYTLKGGMNIEGVRPRQQFVRGTGGMSVPPDYDIRKDGGTWLECGTGFDQVMFNGNNVRGLSIRDLGATRFGTFFSTGGEQIEGTSFSHFSDLQLVGVAGSTPATSIVGFDMANSHHIYSENVTMFRVDTGWHIYSWNCDWQPSNSVITDSHMVNRARGATDPLILLESKLVSGSPTCSESNPTSLNYVTFIRPGVLGSWSDAAGSTAIKFKGYDSSTGIYGITILGLDLEGDAEHMIDFQNRVNSSYIDVAGCALSGGGADIHTDAYAAFNTLKSQCDDLNVNFGSDANMLYGTVNAITGSKPHGNWMLKSTSAYADTDFLTVTPALTVSSGGGSHPAMQSQNTWTTSDTSGYPDFYGSWIDGQIAPGINSGTGRYYGYYANPRIAGGTYTGFNLDAIGFASVPQMGSTVSGTVSNFMAYKANLYFNLGSNWAANVLCYFCADNTLATALPTGASANAFYGLHLPDMAGISSWNWPVLIDAQTGGASKGNLGMGGGAYNTGHFVLGSTHIWEEAAGTLAIKGSAPGSAGDGTRIVTNARSSAAGPAAWAAAGTTCATACTNIGQANCADSIPLDGTNTPTGNCTNTTGPRVCECY